MGEYLKHKFAFIIELTDADLERLTNSKDSLIDKSDEAAMAASISDALYWLYDSHGYYVNAKVTIGELVVDTPHSERLFGWFQVAWLIAGAVLASRYFITNNDVIPVVSWLGFALSIPTLILALAGGITYLRERRQR